MRNLQGQVWAQSDTNLDAESFEKLAMEINVHNASWCSVTANVPTQAVEQHLWVVRVQVGHLPISNQHMVLI